MEKTLWCPKKGKSWRERERERERERKKDGEREREQSPGCESFSRQLLFANMSVGTWSLDKLKTLVEFVI